MIENKLRLLIRLVRYSRDRFLLFLTRQTDTNAKERPTSRATFANLKSDGVVLLFEVLRAIEVLLKRFPVLYTVRFPPSCPLAQFLRISRVAYCCLDFVMSA